MSLLLPRSSPSIGPENPGELIQQALAILDSKEWEFYMAYSIVYDFIVCVIQATATGGKPSPKCRATVFFSSLFGYASVYTSTSIAVNLYMTLLRGTRRADLPNYIEYLYYAVPLLVALCQWAPPTIWAAAHGYCSAFTPIQTGTTAYVLYVVFLQLLLPFCALLFNICVSIRVICVLVREQQSVNKSLREIMQQTHDRLFASTSELDSLSGSSGRKPSIMSEPVRKRLELNLLVMRKFNSAAIRIALYPFAPIAWWIINAIYYALQYSITMTYREDVGRWVRMVSLAWFSMPAIAIANFAVFVTDPAFVKVVKEVCRQLISTSRYYIRVCSQGLGYKKEQEVCNLTGESSTAAKEKIGTLGRRHYSDSTLAFDDSNMFNMYCHEKLPRTTEKSQQMAVPTFSAASASNSSHDNLGNLESSIESSSDDECIPSLLDAVALETSNANRESQMSQSTAVLSTYGEMVRRHLPTGNGEDANRFYSKI
ncbi:hypothetical protein EV177_008253 [Coemansia sp. RSA 1804]|nr:hypothetical protein EV177_008253 [Coemansia sp. RSA 1804]